VGFLTEPAVLPKGPSDMNREQHWGYMSSFDYLNIDLKVAVSC